MKIIDNFFSDSEYKQFVIDSKAHDREFGNYNSATKYITKNKMSNEFKKIISASYKKLNYQGVVYWPQNSKYHSKNGVLDFPRHKDYTEFIENGNSVTRIPEITFVYYVELSKNYSGGELMIYTDESDATKVEVVVPQKNRLVIFDGNNEHEVMGFDGDRLSVVLNPWDTAPALAIID
tara:strand:- start:1551 stop:2084 length:534 start_codon:yes stop_codon:yes gene_type:complete